LAQLSNEYYMIIIFNQGKREGNLPYFVWRKSKHVAIIQQYWKYGSI